jgi:hypothetical protein
VIDIADLDAKARREERMRLARSLFDGYPASVRNRFRQFHAENPRVYELFRERAFQMRRVRERYSARTIIEVIRWHFDVASSGDVFEINGDFVPLYARLLIYHHPEEFIDFFELRCVRSRGITSAEERDRREAAGLF